MGGCCKYKIPINILSPIHIGSKDTFYANEYLFLDDEVYRINVVNFFNSSLSRKNQEKLIKLIQNEDFSLAKLKSIDVDLLKSYSKYHLINKCSSYPVKNNVQIECAIKSQNKFFIPGSSIKGAIKTALFYNAFQLNEIPDLINKVLYDDYHSIIHEYFRPLEENPSRFNNILRFLHIEDSSDFEGLPHLHEVQSWKTHKIEKRLIINRYTTRYLETIPESNTLQTVMTINYDDRFFQELNFNKDHEELLTLENISESLFNLADDLIDYQIKFFSEFHHTDLVEFYKELMEYNFYNKPLIILGGASGLYAKNIYLKIHDYDKKNNTHYSENYAQLLFKNVKDPVFPKTRNITLTNQPLGWAQLDFSSYI